MRQFVTEWDADRFKRKIAARALEGMDRACAYAAERARADAPVATYAPKGREGQLRESVTYVVVPHGTTVEGIVGVKRKAFWAWFVELGTRKMAAHPFLRPAVFNNAAEIMRLFCGGGE